MNGHSVGAMSGARAAYEIHSQSNNQENQTSYKQALPGNDQRQQPSSNPRSPLSSLPPSRKATNEHGRALHSRSGESGHTKMDERSGMGANGVALSKSETYDDIPENMYRPEKGEYEGWIHREKLAKIENEELQAAGINLAKARSRSRDALNDSFRDKGGEQSAREPGPSARGEKKRKISSPLNELEDDRSNWDFRTPEEIAAEAATDRMYSSPALRKSGSKIPILTSSPTPIPSERYDRETPMPRKRTMSGSITPEDPLAIAKRRSEGVGGDSETFSSASQSGSPSKVRSSSVTISRPGTSSGLKGIPVPRKVSTTSKPIPPSASNGRPTTRGNDADRPRTAVNRPEGDPPWLATMYKPDPRLPPDQQIIPTLAKKQLQEQWAQDGQVPKTYDRDFKTLEVHDNGNPGPTQPSNEVETPPEKSEEPNTWPLKPLQATKSPPAQVNRPSTGTSGVTGGYSTMPKVSSPPIGFAPSPRIGSTHDDRASRRSSIGPGSGKPLSPGPTPIAPPTRIQSHRPQPLTDAEDEKVQKKGCCCIVM